MKGKTVFFRHLCLVVLACSMLSACQKEATEEKLAEYLQEGGLTLSVQQESHPGGTEDFVLSGHARWEAAEEIVFLLENRTGEDLAWAPEIKGNGDGTFETGLSVRVEGQWFVVPQRKDVDFAATTYPLPAGEATEIPLFSGAYPELCPGTYRYSVVVSDMRGTDWLEVPLAVEFQVAEK